MSALSAKRHQAPTDETGVADSNPNLQARWAQVVELASDGTIRARTEAGDIVPAMLATHIPGVVIGQFVMLANGPAGNPIALVVAAQPAAGAPTAPPLHFDPETGELRIQGVTLQLQADTQLTLLCGDCTFVLTRDGLVELRADRIVSAAVETHRIEGGSIEFN